MTVLEKVSYLKGLTDGLGIDESTKEGKILAAILDVLDEIGTELADMQENELCIGDELDALSDDLADVEAIVYDDEDDECEDCDGCDGCPGCFDSDEDYEDDEELMYTVECPDCNQEINVDESILDSGSVECPNCGALLEFGFDDDDEEIEDNNN